MVVAGARQAVLAGKLLVQLTTGSPQDAKGMAALLQRIGVRYLDGAVQVAPEQMGQPDTTILRSGAQGDADGARTVLAALGSSIEYRGAEVAAADVDVSALISALWLAV